MSDLIQRLSFMGRGDQTPTKEMDALFSEAAIEILRLQARVAELETENALLQAEIGPDTPPLNDEQMEHLLGVRSRYQENLEATMESDDALARQIS